MRSHFENIWRNNGQSTDKLIQLDSDPNRARRFSLFKTPPDDKTEPELTVTPDTGILLATARQEMNLTHADIADSLHLSEEIIDSIEKCEYHNLFGKAYATGYVRAYASVVNLNADELIAKDPELGIVSVTEMSFEPPTYRRRAGRKPYYSATWSAIAVRSIIVVVLCTLAVFGWNYRSDIFLLWNDQSSQEKVIDFRDSTPDAIERNTPTEPGGNSGIQTPS